MTQLPKGMPDFRLSGFPEHRIPPARSALVLGVAVAALLAAGGLLGIVDPTAGDTLGIFVAVFPGYGGGAFGAAAGAFYGLAAGAAAGWLIAVTYNRLLP